MWDLQVENQQNSQICRVIYVRMLFNYCDLFIVLHSVRQREENTFKVGTYSGMCARRRGE